jgi:membrane associated rhomboid family serine protease
MSYYRRGYYGFTMSPVVWLITINLLVFIIVNLARLKGYNLYPHLGVQGASVLSQPWTLVTAMFVHGGFWHLFANMITLFFFGNFLSQLVNYGRFFIVYFIGGIAGNLLFILLAPPFDIAVGASGALFALGGALAFLRPKVPVFIFPIPAPVPLFVAVIGGFIILSFLPGVAWQAHLGGMLVGLVAGYIFRKQRF